MHQAFVAEWNKERDALMAKRTYPIKLLAHEVEVRHTHTRITHINEDGYPFGWGVILLLMMMFQRQDVYVPDMICHQGRFNRGQRNPVTCMHAGMHLTQLDFVCCCCFWSADNRDAGGINMHLTGTGDAMNFVAAAVDSVCCYLWSADTRP